MHRSSSGSLRAVCALAIFTFASANFDARAESTPSRRATASTYSQRVVVRTYNSLDVLRRANQSTVRIEARAHAGRRTQYSSGAGVVLSSNGYVVTAYHVVRGYPSVEVATVDGFRFAADVVEVKDEYDIALLKIHGHAKLEAASLASSSRIRSGRAAVVIGNPMGGGQTAIAGVLGETRTVRWDGNRATLRTIQADVIPGNSGGGAFDRDTGELLGITVAKSTSQDSTGYVVPSDLLVRLLSDDLPILELVDANRIISTLGAHVRPVQIVSGRFETGMLVTHVEPNSPASSAGWKVGDVVVGLDKYQTKSLGDMAYVLSENVDASTPVSFLLAATGGLKKGEMQLGEPTLTPPSNAFVRTDIPRYTR